MPLMLPAENTGMPFIRYSSNEDLWSHSTENDGMMDIDMVDGKLPSPMIIDIENIDMGWLMLATGARDWRPWPSVNEQTEKPSDDYKVGFSVRVYSKKLFDDAPLREFCSSGAGLLMFIKALYNECEGEFGKGKVPVVQIHKTPTMKLGKGNTRNPKYEIVKWVDRPEEMLADAPSVESTEQQSPTKADDDVFDDDEI
tara:strand:+ start:680 stop:1273 length:594 start_codon:yes stop_codon:yes gene_type:complete